MLYETSIPTEEVSRCLLCDQAACAQACPAQTDPARILRSLRFENPVGAAAALKESFSCAGCSAP